MAWAETYTQFRSCHKMYKNVDPCINHIKNVRPCIHIVTSPQQISYRSVCFLVDKNTEADKLGLQYLFWKKMMDVRLIPYKPYDMTFQIESLDILQNLKNYYIYK
jgi:hypothetical protein